MAIEVELSPVARRSGIFSVHDVDLEDARPLSVGSEIEVVDEGGQVHRARVETTRPARFGAMYQLRLLDVVPPA